MQHADLAPLADSREVVSLLPLDQEAGVRKDNLHSACTWFFRAKALSKPDKSFKDVLDSRKLTGRMPGRRGRCFCHYFYMLPHLQIGFGNDLDLGLCAWLCKYSAWFAQTLAANESSRTSWTSRDQIRGDFARKKSTRPTIHTPLFEIFSTKQWKNGWWMVNRFGWIMLETAKNPHIKTINMQARVFACDCSLATWSKIRRCAGSPKDTPDNVVASCVFYSIRMLRSLGPDSEHWCPVQVEMIVHSKQLCHFRRRTLLGWLGESVHP